MKERSSTSRCIVVKIPGHVPSHLWKEGKTITRADLRDGEKDGYTGPVIEIQFVDNGRVITPRYQLAERMQNV